MRFIFFLICTFFIARPGFARIVVIADAKGAVPALNTDQVKNYFLGEASFLPSGEKVRLGDQEKGSKIRDGFYDALAKMTTKEVSVHWAKKIFAGRGSPPVYISGG